MRILIVEDEQVSRKYLEKLLSRYGECHMVEDGMQALKAYVEAVESNKPFKLICMDIMMPKMDGIETLKAIREFEKVHGICHHCPCSVIMTTALNDTDTIIKTYDSACEAYLVKPVDPEKLTEVLQRLRLI